MIANEHMCLISLLPLSISTWQPRTMPDQSHVSGCSAKLEACMRHKKDLSRQFFVFSLNDIYIYAVYIPYIFYIKHYHAHQGHMT